MGRTFKVMVIGDAARDALIPFLRAVGFAAEHVGGADEAVDAIRQRREGTFFPADTSLKTVNDDIPTAVKRVASAIP